MKIKNLEKLIKAIANRRTRRSSIFCQRNVSTGTEFITSSTRIALTLIGCLRQRCDVWPYIFILQPRDQSKLARENLFVKWLTEHCSSLAAHHTTSLKDNGGWREGALREKWMIVQTVQLLDVRANSKNSVKDSMSQSRVKMQNNIQSLLLVYSSTAEESGMN